MDVRGASSSVIDASQRHYLGAHSAGNEGVSLVKAELVAQVELWNGRQTVIRGTRALRACRGQRPASRGARIRGAETCVINPVV
jgi:hypothetical protein